jgi:hypothetical protein
MDGSQGKKTGFLSRLMPAHSIGYDETGKPRIDQKSVLIVGSKPLKGFRPSHPLECCQNIRPVLGKGIKRSTRV